MKKIAIIGGGASGLVCAVEAARCNPNAEITIYEAAVRIGKKILATGNGRCNLTNMIFSANYYHGSADFAMKVMKEFPPESNIEFFNSLGLYTKADSCGRVYPLSGQASSVVDVLLFAVENLGIKTVCEYRVEQITRCKNGFLLNNEKFAHCVVIAAGGKVPLNKADTCNCYSLLSSLGHKMVKAYPSLVQLTSNDKNLKSLKGIRADVVLLLSDGNRLIKKEKGELLFTDYGLSGIVSMQLSAYASRYIGKTGKKMSVFADFVPSFSFEELRKAIDGICHTVSYLTVEDVLNGFMAKKLGKIIIKKCTLDSQMPVSRLSKRDISAICSAAKNYEFVINGTKDFSFAQVTAGGADTSEFNTDMQSKRINGLFCCGEALDVDADCGGYNLQWAWSSGRAAGRSVAKYKAE